MISLAQSSLATAQPPAETQEATTLPEVIITEEPSAAYTQEPRTSITAMPRPCLS